jgi:hypothetical protein
MTKDKALKLALEALENGMKFVWSDPEREAGFVAIDAMKEALAQPAQEPVVAGVSHIDDLDLWHFYPLQETVNFPAGTKFYTAPPQRPWVGLTDEEVREICVNEWGINEWGGYEQCRAIEAKLKEKNNG